jgi:CheY-like chemotaxis protein
VRILYVDDDLEDAEIFCEAVHFIDSTIEWQIAKSGDEAITKLYQPCPEFIFLDYRMPQKDGKQILEELRGHDCFKNTKVVMYSTFMHETEIEECRKLGAHECMKKSPTFADLCNNLKKLLKGSL